MYWTRVWKRWVHVSISPPYRRATHLDSWSRFPLKKVMVGLAQDVYSDHYRGACLATRAHKRPDMILSTRDMAFHLREFFFSLFSTDVPPLSAFLGPHHPTLIRLCNSSTGHKQDLVTAGYGQDVVTAGIKRPSTQIKQKLAIKRLKPVDEAVQQQRRRDVGGD